MKNIQSLETVITDLKTTKSNLSQIIEDNKTFYNSQNERWIESGTGKAYYSFYVEALTKWYDDLSNTINCLNRIATR